MEDKVDLNQATNRAGIDKSGIRPHCLHVGGATACENSLDGGELVAGYMGMSRSSAGDDCLHAGICRLHQSCNRERRRGCMRKTRRHGLLILRTQV